MVKRGTARARPPPDAAPPDPKKPRVNTAVPTTVTLLVELATWKPPAPDGTPSTVHAPVFLTSPAGAETSDAAVVIIPGAGGNGNALGMESFASSLSSALSAHVVRISLTGNQQWPVRRACTVLALIERLSHGASRLPRVDSFVLVGISNGARVASVVTDALPPTAGLRGTVLVSYPIKGGNGAARTEHVRLVTKSDMHPKLAFIHSAGDPACPPAFLGPMLEAFNPAYPEPSSTVAKIGTAAPLQQTSVIPPVYQLPGSAHTIVPGNEHAEEGVISMCLRFLKA